jgi:predicted metalloprotease
VAPLAGDESQWKERRKESLNMRWKNSRRSSNVEDRRGQAVSQGAAGAPLMLLRVVPLLFRSKAGRALLLIGIVVIVGGKLMGVDVLAGLFGGAPSAGPSQPPSFSAAEQEQAEFAAAVLAMTEDAWRQEFAARGASYREPTLVLFSRAVNSACGMASSAVGPFYCPGDRKLYLDLSFFHDLAQRHDAPGDFAQAYVIAHEVGHHIQTLTGISQQVRQAGRGRSEAEVNALSVRQELQADCYAGVWGHIANRSASVLEPGDLEEALNAASAIGDDRLQRESGRSVVPDSFTHGSSAQRVEWFRRGFESGSMEACDTFDN